MSVVFLAGLIAFVAFIISLFPNIEVAQVTNIGTEILKYGLFFLPAGCWATFLATITAFNLYKFSWAIIEWVYKKIPGVS